MIRPQDEGLHPVGREKWWQESWYFNWSDAACDMFGGARIGMRFAHRRIDGLVFMIQGGKPFFAYPAINVRPRKPWSEFDPQTGIGAAKLDFRMEEPLKRWRLSLAARDGFDLEFTAFTDAYDYKENEADGPPGIAAAHYEQSGTVRGEARLKGRRFDIDALGQRDHSWGVRDWQNILGWSWIAVQFGKDFSFNAWQARREGGGGPYCGGFVFRDGKNHPVERVEIRYHTRAGSRAPDSVELVVQERGGEKYEVECRTRGVFPLAKDGLWLNELYADFRTTVKGTQRTGLGVIEQTFHVGRLGYVSRWRDIAGTLKQVFLEKSY